MLGRTCDIEGAWPRDLCASSVSIGGGGHSLLSYLATEKSKLAKELCKHATQVIVEAIDRYLDAWDDS